MLLKDYEHRALLINLNFIEPAGPGLFAFRGDMVLVEGEVTDASGRRKPPVSSMRQAVILADERKIKFAGAWLGDLAKLGYFIERYAADFAPDMQALFLVANIPAEMVVVEAGVSFVLIPLIDGLVWNELVDAAALEKSDLKGQSSGEKVTTVVKALAGRKSKGDRLSLAEAMARTIEVELVSRGAV